MRDRIEFGPGGSIVGVREGTRYGIGTNASALFAFIGITSCFAPES
jgi:hypothetical protein